MEHEALNDLMDALDHAHNYNAHLWFEVGYTRPTDWMVHVWDKRGGGERMVIRTEDVSREAACREAAQQLRKLYPSR